MYNNNIIIIEVSCNVKEFIKSLKLLNLHKYIQNNNFTQKEQFSDHYGVSYRNVQSFHSPLFVATKVSDS